MTAGPYRCGFVALVGKPNVGKSTLLNALVGEHLSIVSPKAQTTREHVRGILTTERFQMLLIDAPGLLEPRYALQEAMRLAASAALEEADVIVHIADATRPRTLPDQEFRRASAARTVPVIAAVNKIDLVDGRRRAELERTAESCGFAALSVSAITREGLDELLERLVPLLPESPPLFPADDMATQSLRFFAQEYVRETCIEQFRDEVPYSITCRVEEFREQQEPIYIRAVIYVERASQKGIVIGRGGEAIKRVGAIAREKIEALIGAGVFLDLRVKVMPGWSRKRGRLRQLGFQVPPQTRGGQKGS